MTDVELVGAVQEGNTDAEALLYARYGSRVFYLGLRHLRTHADAEDVRSETTLRVIQALRQGKLRVPAALAGFVLETARNVIRERVRREARLTPIDPDRPDETTLRFDPPSVDPIAARALDRTVASLRTRDRAFLRLYYYEDLPTAEISRRLGIAEERLRLVKSRTLKRFRARFEQLIAR